MSGASARSFRRCPAIRSPSVTTGGDKPRAEPAVRGRQRWPASTNTRTSKVSSCVLAAHPVDRTVGFPRPCEPAAPAGRPPSGVITRTVEKSRRVLATTHVDGRAPPSAHAQSTSQPGLDKPASARDSAIEPLTSDSALEWVGTKEFQRLPGRPDRTGHRPATALAAPLRSLDGMGDGTCDSTVWGGWCGTVDSRLRRGGRRRYGWRAHTTTSTICPPALRLMSGVKRDGQS